MLIPLRFGFKGPLARVRGAACVLLALLSFAPSSMRFAAAQPILHEPVAAPSLRCQDGVCRSDANASADKGDLPDAVLGEDGLIGAPLMGRNPQEHEPIFNSDNQASSLAAAFMRGAPPKGQDPPPSRRVRVAPDADTGPEPPGQRVYHEVFNPAIFPYKRMTVVDAVDESGSLYVADQRRRELTPTPTRLSVGRDPFYASVVVDLVAGQWVSLPTPASSVRLFSYKTTPYVPLRFFIDGADNLYALAARSGRYRLVYLVDAEQRYFAGPLFPAALRKSGVRLDALPPPSPLPRGLRRDADKVLRHIGVRVSPNTDYADLLNRLVTYFRSFQIEELPTDGAEARGSLYLRIALGQRGVCRHRAYAFVITALAAGIPARYVENELHVFVEVWIPAVPGQSGYWRRINLGGAPLEQRVYGGESREVYQEKGEDPFDRPKAFSQATPPRISGLPMGLLPGKGKGGQLDRAALGIPSSGSEQSRDGRSAAGSPSELAGNPSSEAAANPSGRAPSVKERSRDKEAPADSAATAFGMESKEARLHAPGTPIDAGEGDVPTRMAADRIEQPTDVRSSTAADALISTRVHVNVGAIRRIYRGAAVSVHGQVQAARGAKDNLEVILLLAVPQRPIVLGRTVTRSDGSFAAEVEIPGAAPLGHFQIVARVRGDETRRGSSSGPYDRLPSSTATEFGPP